MLGPNAKGIGGGGGMLGFVVNAGGIGGGGGMADDGAPF